jgi:hypothetical protein
MIFLGIWLAASLSSVFATSLLEQGMAIGARGAFDPKRTSAWDTWQE